MKSKTDFTPKHGWVYVLTNDCLKPVRVKYGPNKGQKVPAVKIGHAKDFTSRLGSLNTSVYTNFVLHLAIKTDDVVGLEQLIHESLSDYRIFTPAEESTEFFAYPLDAVIKKIKNIAKHRHVECTEFKGGKVIGRCGSSIRRNLEKQKAAKASDAESTVQTSTKAKATSFSVLFSDGTTIESDKAKEVFVQAIKKLGVGRVAKIDGVTFVSRGNAQFGPYAGEAVKVGSWYVSTHSSTERKIKRLKKVAKALGEEIVITVNGKN